jgi:hydroxymethylbilane synthase
MAYRIRIGSRPSALALVQANAIKREIERLVDGIAIEIVAISTSGDRMTSALLARVGGKGLFVRELEQALADDKIDIAVHSLKDLPAVLPEQFRIVAVPTREDPRDALLIRNGDARVADKREPWRAIGLGARIGTSSARRQYELLRVRPDFAIAPLRGNVDTRLRRLADGDFDAIVLAMAGLKRLGKIGELEGISLHPLDEENFVPSGGQAALAIEALRAEKIGGSQELTGLIASLNDAASRAEVTAERSFLATIGASCVSPVGVKGAVKGERLALRALLFSADGSTHMGDACETILSLNDEELEAIAQECGEALGKRMIAAGARAMIEQA